MCVEPLMPRVRRHFAGIAPECEAYPGSFEGLLSRTRRSGTKVGFVKARLLYRTSLAGIPASLTASVNAVNARGLRLA